MARVTRIEVIVGTGNAGFFEPPDGTDGFVYAGVGGREFLLDAVGNDFVVGSSLTYVVGAGSNLKTNVFLDSVIIDTQDVLDFPVYLRMEPKRDVDRWELMSLHVIVNPGPQELRFVAPFNIPNERIQLGSAAGKWIFMHPEA